MTPRLPAIDLLRGLVIVLMALDHVRDFFSDALAINPTDPDQSNGPLFLTRWVTHYCAPVFVLLAGIGAALAQQRGLTQAGSAKFLITRGLWLVLLELTLVRLGFYFSTDFHDVIGLVIWTLGWCMVLLAGLQYLPRPVLMAFSLLLIVGHNRCDAVTPEVFGPFDWLWIVLHAPGTIPLGGNYTLVPPYKLVPWIGVMALGFSLGPVFAWQRPARRRFLLRLWLLVLALFFVVRGINHYGDPLPWYQRDTLGQTVMAFLNCEKYPPSLCYLLMTLGPAFLALAAFDRPPGWLGRRLMLFGRVPLFFYLLHLPLIHGLAVLVSMLQTGDVAPWLLAPPAQASAPPGYGYPLPVVYAVWLLVVLLLYPLCAWYANLKKRYPGGLLSYL